MLKFDLNWLHIGVVALANFVLGWAWYSPLLFAKPWMKALKIHPEKMRRDPEAMKDFPLLMGSAAATAVLMSLGTQVLVVSLGALDAGQGAMIGCFLAVTLVASHASGSLFERRPRLVWAIGALHALAVLVMDGAIHAVWR